MRAALPLCLAAFTSAACDAPTSLGALPSRADAAPDAPVESPPRAVLRCRDVAPSHGEALVAVRRDRPLTLDDARLVMHGGPWGRGATSPYGALLLPDPACGARLITRRAVDGGVVVEPSACLAGLSAARSLQLFYNRNRWGVCAGREGGSFLVGLFDEAGGAFTRREEATWSAATCASGEQWEASVAQDARGARWMQFYDTDFAAWGAPHALDAEPEARAPAALVNLSRLWAALWVVGDEGRRLLFERYALRGAVEPGAVYPRVIEGVARDTRTLWDVAQVGGRSVRVFGAVDRADGLLALLRVDGVGGSWVGGALFCPGGMVHVRRLFEGAVDDASLVLHRTDWVLLTRRQSEGSGVIEATWVSAALDARGTPKHLIHGDSLVLHGADDADGGNALVVWYSTAGIGGEGDARVLRVATFLGAP